MTKYLSIYFDELGIVTCKSFDTKAEALADSALHDWGVVVKYAASRTITTQT